MKYIVAMVIFLIVGSILFTYLATSFGSTVVSLLFLFSLSLGLGWFAGGLRMILEQRDEMKKFLEDIDNK